MSEESGQAAELNSYHSDIDPSFGAGRSSFVITDQSALTHQPAKGALHDPASRQHFETRGSIGTFDNLDRQFGAKLLDPLSEGFAGIATIDPQDAEPSEPAQYAGPKTTCAPARSVVLAGVTATPSTSPKVSTNRWRLRPLIRLPAS